jgi:hypothetical protein
MSARITSGDTLFLMGERLRAREQFEEAISLYDPEHNRGLAGFVDPGVPALSFAAMTRWNLGYPDQALKRSNEALALAQALSRPHSLVFAQLSLRPPSLSTGMTCNSRDRRDCDCSIGRAWVY